MSVDDSDNAVTRPGWRVHSLDVDGANRRRAAGSYIVHHPGPATMCGLDEGNVGQFAWSEIRPTTDPVDCRQCLKALGRPPAPNVVPERVKRVLGRRLRQRLTPAETARALREHLDDKEARDLLSVLGDLLAERDTKWADQ